MDDEVLSIEQGVVRLNEQAVEIARLREKNERLERLAKTMASSADTWMRTCQLAERERDEIRKESERLKNRLPFIEQYKRERDEAAALLLEGYAYIYATGDRSMQAWCEQVDEYLPDHVQVKHQP